LGFVSKLKKKLLVLRTAAEREIDLMYSSAKYPQLNAVFKLQFSKSAEFFDTLQTWLTGFHRKLTSITTPDEGLVASTRKELLEMKHTKDELEEESWTLCKQILTDIFHAFSKHRIDGGAAESMDPGSPEQFATVLYAAQRGINFGQELMAAAFEKHPNMAPSFNAFLFTERASKSDIRRTDRMIVSLNEQLAGMQSRMDKVKK
jgi:hypothetical protein